MMGRGKLPSVKSLDIWDIMGTLKREEIDARRYWSFQELKANVEEFLEEIYNRVRLHSALSY